ncbi:hypothetical protein BGZ49_002739, partial [Haplosporangium sp. Z 27]
SNKNKSASAATTPAQTPRTSMQETRPSQNKTMSHEEVLEMAMSRSFQHAPSMPINSSRNNII